MPDLALFLLVDDNPNDCVLLQRAFQRANIVNPVHTVNTCQEAIDYLTGAGKYKDRSEFPLPALVLLDLNMPSMSGLDLLRWIRGTQEFKGLRVIMLSGSQDLRDMNEAYQAGANSFLLKPADFDKLVEISRALGGYWVWRDQAGVTAPETEKRAGNNPSKPAS